MGRGRDDVHPSKQRHRPNADTSDRARLRDRLEFQLAHRWHSWSQLAAGLDCNGLRETADGGKRNTFAEATDSWQGQAETVMFKGLGQVNFSYSSGTVSGSNGWTYSIRARFDSQMTAQPQYGGITDGWRYIANMAIGLADDDYRAKFGVMPGTNLSEFGQWIDGNRQAVYNEAQGWFTYVPPVPGGAGSGGSSSSGGSGGSSSTDAGFLGSVGTLGIIAAVALGVLLLVKR